MKGTSLRGMEEQVGHCGVCLRRWPCRVVDLELGRPICAFCVFDLEWAERVLERWGKKAGMRRPKPGTLLMQ